jgi:hypothetical protein
MEATLVSWPPDDELGAVRFYSRAFASNVVDLDVDFLGARRPVIVTDLLRLCLRAQDGHGFDAAQVRSWTIAQRLQGVLAIAFATTGARISAVTSCTAADCREEIEIELGLDGFANDAPPTITWQTHDGHQVQSRLPNGDDQDGWYQQSRSTGSVDERWFAARLVTSIDGVAPPAEFAMPVQWLDGVAAACAEIDQLTDLTVGVSCPVCEASLAVALDLESLLLVGLERQQRRLVEEVHHLASAYHWAEDDIVNLPAWRRARYLARLQAERS